MATTSNKPGSVVGFMLYGLPQGEEHWALPVEFGDGELIIFSSAEAAQQAYYELLSDVDLQWKEGEIVAAPIVVDSDGHITFPSGVAIAPKKVAEEKGEEKK